MLTSDLGAVHVNLSSPARNAKFDGGINIGEAQQQSILPFLVISFSSLLLFHCFEVFVDRSSLSFIIISLLRDAVRQNSHLHLLNRAIYLIHHTASPKIVENGFFRVLTIYGIPTCINIWAGTQKTTFA